ncbi:hypothetical protein GGI35DRAFT_477956 [Trichoderma velutinum]
MSPPPNHQGVDTQTVINLLLAIFDQYRRQHERLDELAERVNQFMQLWYELRQFAVSITARSQNGDRRVQNFLTQSVVGTTGYLVPLVDLRTGEEIASFPTTRDEISLLDGNESRRILEALDIDTRGMALIAMREMISYLAAPM